MQQAELKNLVQLKKEAVSENLLIERWDHLCLPPQAPPHPQNENDNHRKLIKLITWTTALSKSMELWAMPCRATQDGRIMVESSDRMWSTGERNGKPLQYSCLQNPVNSMKKQNDRTLKDERPRSVVAQYALEKSGEITPERMKRRSQSKNNAQMWTWLVMEVRSDAVKNNIAWEPGMLGPWNKAIECGYSRDSKSKHRHFRNQWTKMNWNGWI